MELSEQQIDQIANELVQQSSNQPAPATEVPAMAPTAGGGIPSSPMQSSPMEMSQPVAPTQEGTKLSDYGKLLGAGGAQVVGGLGWVLNELTDDSFLSLEEAAGSVKEHWLNGMTPAMQESMAKKFVEEKGGELGFGPAVSDPKAILGTIIMSVPSMLPGIGAAGLAGKGAGAIKAVKALGASARQKAVVGAAVVAGSGTEGVIAGASVGQEVEAEVMKAPLKDLMDNELFRATYNETGNIVEARTAVAKKAAHQSAIGAGAVTAILGAPFSATIGRIFTGASRGRGVEAFKGAALESVTEGLQSGNESLQGQVALNEAIGKDMNTADALNNVVGGMAAGGVMGGVMGGIPKPNQQVPESTPAPEVAPTAASIPEVPPTQNAAPVNQPVATPAAQVTPQAAPTPAGLSVASDLVSKYQVINGETGETGYDKQRLWKDIQAMSPAQQAAELEKLQQKVELNEVEKMVETGLKQLKDFADKAASSGAGVGGKKAKNDGLGLPSPDSTVAKGGIVPGSGIPAPAMTPEEEAKDLQGKIKHLDEQIERGFGMVGKLAEKNDLSDSVKQRSIAVGQRKKYARQLHKLRADNNLDGVSTISDSLRTPTLGDFDAKNLKELAVSDPKQATQKVLSYANDGKTSQRELSAALGLGKSQTKKTIQDAALAYAQGINANDVPSNLKTSYSAIAKQFEARKAKDLAGVKSEPVAKPKPAGKGLSAVQAEPVAQEEPVPQQKVSVSKRGVMAAKPVDQELTELKAEVTGLNKQLARMAGGVSGSKPRRDIQAQLTNISNRIKGLEAGTAKKPEAPELPEPKEKEYKSSAAKGFQTGTSAPVTAKEHKANKAKRKAREKTTATAESDRKTARKVTNTAPTEKQIENETYKKGRVRWEGLALSIENPKGSVRKGTSEEGKDWSQKLAADYGEIKGTIGADGDPIDVFLGADMGSDTVFIINQNEGESTAFDEHKVMIGFTSENAAEWGYRDSYENDWNGLGSMHRATVEEFKAWLDDGDHSQPYEPSDKAPEPEPEKKKRKKKVKAEVSENDSRGGKSEGVTAQDEAVITALENDDDAALEKVAAKDPLLKNILAREGLVAQFYNSALGYGATEKELDDLLAGVDDDLVMTQKLMSKVRDLRSVKTEKRVKELEAEAAAKAIAHPPIKTRFKKMDDGTFKKAGKGHWVGSTSAWRVIRQLGLQDTHTVRSTGNEHNNGRQAWVAPKYLDYSGVKKFELMDTINHTQLVIHEYESESARIGMETGLAEFGRRDLHTRFNKSTDTITFAGDKEFRDRAYFSLLLMDKGATEINGVDPIKDYPDMIDPRLKSGDENLEGVTNEQTDKSRRSEENSANDPQASTASKREETEAAEKTEQVSTAPEHTHNEGKPLDRDSVYPDPYGPARYKGDLSDDVMRLEIDHDAFAEVIDPFNDMLQNPDKKTITNQRAGEFISKKAADKKIAGWKAHVADQFKNHRGDNFDKTVLSLFDYTGEWSKPWLEAGYNVIHFDIQNGQDVMDFSAEYFADTYNVGDVHAILAACPCTDFANSGARWFEGKDADGRTEASKELVFQTMRTIEYFRPAVWALENPSGRIKSLTNIPDARMTFEPHHFGETYTKKTILYGNFNPDLPLANVDPIEGSKMHKKYGGKSLATKNARSATPEGFAYSFFMANNYIDMPALKKLEHDYPEVVGAVTEAHKAGISEDRIRELMEDTYGNYDYEMAQHVLAEEIHNLEPGTAKGWLGKRVKGLGEAIDVIKSPEKYNKKTLGSALSVIGLSEGNEQLLAEYKTEIEAAKKVRAELGKQEDVDRTAEENAPVYSKLVAALKTGMTLMTKSKAETTPFPSVGRDKTAPATTRLIDEWLIENGNAEAKRNNDSLNSSLFQLDTLSAENRDWLEAFLFDAVKVERLHEERWGGLTKEKNKPKKPVPPAKESKPTAKPKRPPKLKPDHFEEDTGADGDKHIAPRYDAGGYKLLSGEPDDAPVYQSMNKDIHIAYSQDEDSKYPENLVSFYADSAGSDQNNVSAQTDREEGSYSIDGSLLDEDLKGQGKGLALYQELIDFAHSRGFKINSDTGVSVEAQRIYDALERRGYEIIRNKNTEIFEGSLNTTDRKPLFQVLPKKQSKEAKPFVSNFKENYPLDLAEKSAAHSVRSPKQFAQSAEIDYLNAQSSFYGELDGVATNQKQKDAIREIIHEYADYYLEGERQILEARAGVVSSHIAGNSKFNSKQAGKRGDNLDRVTEKVAAARENHKRHGINQIIAMRTNDEKRAASQKGKEAAHEKLILKIAGIVGDMAQGFDKAALRPSLINAMNEAHGIDTLLTMQGLMNVDKATQKNNGESFVKMVGARSQAAKLFTVYTSDLAQESDAVNPGTEPKAEAEAKPSKLKKAADKIDSEIDAAAAELAALFKAQVGTLNSGIDPQILLVGAKLGGLYVSKGVVKFAEYASAILDKLESLGIDRTQVEPVLKELYGATQANVDDDTFDQMDDMRTVRKFDLDTIRTGESNVSSTGDSLESDSQNDAASNGLGESDVSNERGPDRQGIERSAREAQEGIQYQGNFELSDANAVIAGAGSVEQVYSEDGQAKPSISPTGNTNGRGSADVSESRKPDERKRSKRAKSTTTKSNALGSKELSFAEKVELQRNVDGIEVIPADLSNIRATLPVLLDAQQGDVVKNEQRLIVNNGRGIMVTNGTGTGKTYTGLGTIKRFVMMGKKRILVVTPSQTKVQDWIDDGKNLNLDLSPLKNTKDSGAGIVITTYANMRDNFPLQAEQWDLVVYDESHRLLEEKNGTEGKTTKAHYTITEKSSLHAGYGKAQAEMMPERVVIDKKIAELTKTIVLRGVTAENAETEARKEFSDQINALEKRIKARGEVILAARGNDRAKVLFLSATPFAAHKSIVYARGYIFHEVGTQPKEENYRGYNEPDQFENFLVTNLGYRMRYNKLTQPDAKVNVGLMERNLADEWIKEGVMYGRQLEIEQDYSRDFVRVNSKLGEAIDRGVYDVLNHKDYPQLSQTIHKRFDYLSKKRMVEALNVRESIPRIRQHLALGRKVVIFHDLNNVFVDHPFDFSAERALAMGSKDDGKKLVAEIDKFNRANSDLINIDLSSMQSVPDAIKEAFGDQALLFRGDVNTKDKNANIKAFNDATSKNDIVVIQRQAGKEGLSLHDLTGDKQRALMLMTVPTQATDLPQIEGRIYRLGVQSDAVMEVMTTGLRYEAWAWGHAVGQMTATAENLAFGSNARNLEDSLRDGYVEYTEEAPSLEQGKGGKDLDGKAASITPYDKAKTYFYGRQKRSSKDKAKEGTDYFATPEPVGFKMVEWANQRDGDSNLEPSGGHGAIARWFNPAGNNRTIEQSSQLAAQLKLTFSGEVDTGDFEDLNVINKFDTVVMNPPFGRGGSDAYPHLIKAMSHLRDGGRIVALLPRGPAADKRYQSLVDSPEFEQFQTVADVELPSDTFNRAGTKVATRILVLDRYIDPVERVPTSTIHDSWDDVKTVEELFDHIEDFTLPPRSEVREKAPKPIVGTGASSTTAELDSVPDTFELSIHEHTKTGQMQPAVKLTERISKEDYKQSVRLAKANNGIYSFYAKKYLFDTESERSTFMAEMVEAFPQLAGGDKASAQQIENPSVLKSKIGESYTKSKGRKISRSAVDKLVNEFVSNYKGFSKDDFIIAGSYQAEVERIGVDGGEPAKGLIDFSGEFGAGSQKVWIFADEHSSLADVERTLRHEALVHKGLSVYSPEHVAQLLTAIAEASKNGKGKLARVWADIEARYGEDEFAKSLDAKGRDRYLAEETMAAIAEIMPRTPDRAWDKIVKAFKAFLKKYTFFDVDMYRYSDVVDQIRDIETAIKAGKETGPRRLEDWAGGNMKRLSSGDAKAASTMMANNIDKVIKASAQLKRNPKLAFAQAGESLKSKMVNLSADTRKHWLGGFTRRQLADYAGSKIPFIKEYVNIAQEMDTWRNELMSEAGGMADRWTAWQGKNKAAARALSKLMHKSTIESVDPSKPFKNIIEPEDAATQIEELEAKIKLLGHRAKKDGESGQAKLFQERDDIKFALLRDKRRKRLYDSLRAEYNALPAEAKAFYNEVRDFYSARHDLMLKELESQIGRSVAVGAQARALQAMVREEFEAMQVEGPYFPLARQGEYFASAAKQERFEFDSMSAGKFKWTQLRDAGHQNVQLLERAGGSVVLVEKREFSLFSSQKDQLAFQKKLESEGYTVSIGKKLEDLKEIDGVSAAFMSGVEEKIGSLGDDPAVQNIRDSIYQMYLDTLPALSMRKNFIHRKKVPGYSEDSARAFASHAFHSSYQLSRLRYGDVLQDKMTEMRQAIEDVDNEAFDIEAAETADALNLARDPAALDKRWKEYTDVFSDKQGEKALTDEHEQEGKVLKLARRMAKDKDFAERSAEMIARRRDNVEIVQGEDANRMSDTYTELTKRHEWAMNPQGGQLANVASTVGFSWYLGVSPAAAFVNLTQTPLVAWPLFAAKYGWKDSGAELKKAYGEFMKAGVQRPSRGQVLPGLKKVLTGEELEALEEGYRTGVLDKTLAHDLANIGQDGLEYNPTLNKVNQGVAWAFHNAERVNREVTYMAAYRLARKTMPKHLAIQQAHDLTWDSHFDYSTGNKARFMQGDVAKVVLMFRQFSLNMSYLLGRSLWNSVKGESKAVQQEARKRLTGLLGMHAIFAGAAGMPMYSVITWALEMAFDDEDEPFDADVAFRNALSDTFGKTLGHAISDGPINALTGADIASRVSLDGLWIRGGGPDESGRDAARSLAVAILGPVFGIAQSGLQAAELMSQGETYKAVERGTPKFIRDMMKAGRYANEGVTNRRGDLLLEDVSWWQAAYQAGGLTPAAISQQYERNSALKGMESRIKSRRSLLLNKYWMATRMDDQEHLGELAEIIARFNKYNPEYQLTDKVIQRSLKTRARYTGESINGINLTKSLRHLVDEVRY